MMQRQKSLVEDMQNMRIAAILSGNRELSKDEQQRYERLCSIYEPWGGVGSEIKQIGLSPAYDDAPYVRMVPSDSEALGKIIAAHPLCVASF